MRFVWLLIVGFLVSGGNEWFNSWGFIRSRNCCWRFDGGCLRLRLVGFV